MSAHLALAAASLCLIACSAPAIPQRACAPESAAAATRPAGEPTASPLVGENFSSAELRALGVAKRCSGGDQAACARIASALDKPEPPTHEPAKTSHEPEDDEAAQAYALGKKLLGDPSPASLLAPDHLKRACDGGHAEACNDLGWAWDTGFGTLAKDEAKAAKLFERACELKSSLGCLNRSKLARPTNLAVAADFAARACEHKLEKGCVALAGVVQEAKAACQRSAAACTNWGYLQDFGLGVPKDPAAGLKSYEQACAAGERVGCHNAGVVYQEGTAGKANPVKAKARFQTACTQGYDAACRERDKLAAKR